jgi:hypothetical protein
MGNVLPFGTGAGDESMNQPQEKPNHNSSEGVGAVDPEASVTAKTPPPAAGAAVPVDPRALSKAIDKELAKLRKAVQYLVTVLPPDAIGSDVKRDLLTQYTTLEQTAVELKGRLIPASGEPENTEIAQDFEHLRLDIHNLAASVDNHLMRAGIKKPSLPPISKNTALYIALGVSAVAVGAGLWWAYRKDK